MPWLSVVIPTIGRDTLERTLHSLHKQPESAGVEVLVVADTFGGYSYPLINARELVEAEGDCWLEHDAGVHCVGQPQRTAGMTAAAAPWVWFSQDDDIAAVDSLACIEAAIDAQPRPRPIFFRLLAHWRELIWRTPTLALGNIDADCLVFPRHIAQRCQWGLRYEGDFDVACQAFNFSGGDVGWVDQVVSIARPDEDMLWWR